MLNSYSNTNLQNNSSAITLMDENNLNYFDQHRSQENQKFVRGHIINQYMSGVGVITERYIPDEHLLFFDSKHPLDQSTSLSDVKSLLSIKEEEQEEEHKQFTLTVPVNCPCYEKSREEEFKNNESHKSIFASMFQTFQSEISKLLTFGHRYSE